MLSNSIRCYNLIRHLNCSVVALCNNSSGPHLYDVGYQRRCYSKKTETPSCKCKEVSQTEGRDVEVWPKTDQKPPQAWRKECPKDPHPICHDPYRIKMPSIVVPPMPPCNAKGFANEIASELSKNADQHFMSNQLDFMPNQLPPPNPNTMNSLEGIFGETNIVHPDNWKNKAATKFHNYLPTVVPKLGYHGKAKYKYAFHEPWNPIDRNTLLAEAEKEESGDKEKTETATYYEPKAE